MFLTCKSLMRSRACSLMIVVDTVITMNGAGLSATTGGQIISHNNNCLRGNTTEGAATGTLVQC